MNTFFKQSFLLAAASCIIPVLHAQKAPEPEKTITQNIIIRKKDSTKQKVTVVIDGNKVTVNGKPVDDFESDDVDIISQSSDDVFFYGHGSKMTMTAPAPPPAQMRTFSRDMTRSIKTNGAFLGIMSEKTDQGAKITEVTEAAPPNPSRCASPRLRDRRGGVG